MATCVGNPTSCQSTRMGFAPLGDSTSEYVTGR